MVSSIEHHMLGLKSIFDLFSIPTSILFPELTQKKQTQPKITCRLSRAISIGRSWRSLINLSLG
jgi:hypothetical protein